MCSHYPGHNIKDQTLGQPFFQDIFERDYKHFKEVLNHW
jgi:hypothetical protein